MQEVQCEEIKMASAKRARSLISPYNQDKIESISKATVQMYNWVRKNIPYLIGLIFGTIHRL